MGATRAPPGQRRCLRWPRWVALTLAATLAAPVAASPEVQWPPKAGLLDEDSRIVVSGLLPGTILTLQASERTDDLVWQSWATYTADGRGVVDTAVAAAMSGTWHGVDPAGWLWSMVPEEAGGLVEMQQRIASDPTVIARWRRPSGDARRVRVQIREAGRTIGSTIIERRRVDPGVGVEDVMAGETGIAGKLFLPRNADACRDTGIVALGGSLGGIDPGNARLLASHGYAAIALAYFKYGGLTDNGSMLPLEYFEDAIEWFRKRANVRKVVLLGRSRGGEATLLFGSLFPDSADGLIAVVPSHLVNNGEGEAWGDWLADETSMWTHGGRQVPFAPYVDSQTDEIVARRERAKAALPGYATSVEYALVWRGEENGPFAIDVGSISVPVLVLAGEVDAIWPSATSARIIREQLKASGSTEDSRVEIYPEAGHMWGLPGEIATQSDFLYVGENFDGFVALGGSIPGNAAAARHSWRSILRFVEDLTGDAPVACR